MAFSTPLIDTQTRFDGSAATRSASSSSLSSAASDAVDTYASRGSAVTRELNAAGEKKQTAQARDWRPKSTLHTKKFSELRGWELLCKIAVMDNDYYDMRPDVKRGPIPHYPFWKTHAFVLPRALFVPALQHISMKMGYRWPTGVAYVLYLLQFQRFLRSTVQQCNHWAREYGTLDEKNIGRDRIPDKEIPRLGFAFLAFMLTRTAGEFYLKWNKRELPFSSFTWKTPIKMGLWVLAADYFFYCYHRLSHETSLWKIHAHHHTTRHPSPALAILADNVQECLEIALIPLAATLLVPMKFHELLLTIYYVTSVEIIGHAGVRLVQDQPIIGPLLRMIGCELVLEDHDLHHRYGKSGRNYGKQTRIWDRLFGTCTPREEMANMKGYNPW